MRFRAVQRNLDPDELAGNYDVRHAAMAHCAAHSGLTLEADHVSRST